MKIGPVDLCIFYRSESRTVHMKRKQKSQEPEIISDEDEVTNPVSHLETQIDPKSTQMGFLVNILQNRSIWQNWGLLWHNMVGSTTGKKLSIINTVFIKVWGCWMQTQSNKSSVPFRPKRPKWEKWDSLWISFKTRVFGKMKEIKHNKYRFYQGLGLLNADTIYLPMMIINEKKVEHVLYFGKVESSPTKSKEFSN